jgi:hypothetical protein
VVISRPAVEHDAASDGASLHAVEYCRFDLSELLKILAALRPAELTTFEVLQRLDGDLGHDLTASGEFESFDCVLPISDVCRTCKVSLAQQGSETGIAHSSRRYAILCRLSCRRQLSTRRPVDLDRQQSRRVRKSLA